MINAGGKWPISFNPINVTLPSGSMVRVVIPQLAILNRSHASIGSCKLLQQKDEILTHCLKYFDEARLKKFYGLCRDVH